MALTPEDVRNKQFSTAKRKSGYEMDEVDAFLDQVELELGALQRENAELRGRLAAAEQGAARAAAAPVQAPPPPPVAAPVVQAAPAAQNVSEQAVAMLALAQRTAEEHTTRARIEADDLLSAARVKVADLERQGQIDRTSLERRIEELRAFEREYRSRLRQHYEAALRDLEGRTDAPSPAPSVPAAPAAAAPSAPAPAAPAPAAPAPQVAVAPPAPPAAPAMPQVPGSAGPSLTPPPPPPAAPNPYTPPAQP